MKMIRIRIKHTGQVTEMVPDVAKRMIAGGTAEEVKASAVETMAVAPVAEHAVAPAQKPTMKPAFSRKRAG